MNLEITGCTFATPTTQQCQPNKRLGEIRHVLERRYLWQAIMKPPCRGASRYGVACLEVLSRAEFHANRPSFFQKMLSRLDSILDTVAFCCHWEVRVQRSGIIVATLTKG